MTQAITTDLDYPLWVCGPCGRLYGRLIPDGVSTYNQNDCGVCGENAAVTSPRNFGHLKDGWQNHKAISQPKGQ